MRAEGGSKTRTLKLRMNGADFQIIHTACPVNGKPIHNWIRLDAPRGLAQKHASLFPEKREWMLMGHVCRLLGLENPQELDRFIERCHLRGRMQLQFV